MNRIVFISFLLFVAQNVFAQQYAIPLNNSNVNSNSLQKKASNKRVINYSIPGITHAEINTQKGTFSQISFQGAYRSGITGEPQLPVSKQLIEIPIGAEIRVQVIDHSYNEYSLKEYGINNKVIPFQPSLPKTIDAATSDFEINQTSYRVDEFNENEIAIIEIIGTMRGMRIAQLSIYPVRYNPVQDRIKVFNNIQVEVVYEGNDIKKSDNDNLSTYSPYFESLYNVVGNSNAKEAIIDNPDLTNYPVKYLIVTAPQYKEQLTDFVTWKTQKGFTVNMVTTDEIGATSTEIKTWIHEQYNSATDTDPAPSFVLLVGSDTQIPTSQIGNSSRGVTDLYYVCVDGTDDYIPDMYIGRFSVENTSQLDNILEKVLYYEKYEFEDDTFLNDVTLIAGADGIWNPRVGQPTVNYGTEYYFNTANGYSNVNDYLSTYSGCYNSEKVGVSFINYTAHCSYSSWSNPSLSKTTITGLTNNNKYPLAVGNCCQSANFGYSSECIGESWMRQEKAGAVAYIGSVPDTYWWEDFYWAVGAHEPVYNEYPTVEGSEMGVYDAMFVSDYVSVAGLMYLGNLTVTEASENNNPTDVTPRYYWEAYHCLSDPSLIIYNTSGEDNIVRHSQIIVKENNEFEVHAEPGSMVAISKDSVLLGTAIVPESGISLVGINQINSDGEAEIVVTKPQYKPYVAKLIVTATDSSFLYVNDFSANKELINYGDSFSIELSIKNIGLYKSENITASILTNSKYIKSFTDNIEININDIAINETITIEGKFQVELSDSIPDQKEIQFDIILTDSVDGNKQEFIYTEYLLVNAPILQIGNILLVDDVDENNNNHIDGGELVLLKTEITNTGHAAVSTTVNILFPTSNPYLTVIESTIDVGNLNPDETKAVEFSVQASENELPAANIFINVVGYESNGVGYSNTENFELLIGNESEIEYSSIDIVVCEQISDIETNYIVGAEVMVGDEIVFTDTNGVASFEFNTEQYGINYQVAAYKYDTVQGNLNISKESTSFSVDLEPIYFHYITFNVADSIASVEFATVLAGDSIALTNEKGIAIFQFEKGSQINYTISSLDHFTCSGEIMVDKNETIEIDLFPLPDVSFNVFDNDTFISDAQIIFNNDTLKTNEFGDLTIENIQRGYHTYSVSKNGYYNVFDSCYIDSSNVNINVSLSYIPDLVISVTNGNEPIENAVVKLNGLIYNTNANGEVVFVDIEEGSYSYNIESDDYFPASGTVDIGNINITETIIMNSLAYNVNFNVSDGNNPLEWVQIYFNSEQKITDSDGNIMFYNVTIGNEYNYEISKNGFDIITGKVDVIDGNVNMQIELNQNAFNVNFVVSDKNGIVEGALVYFNNEYESTNNIGHALFSNVPVGLNSHYIVSNEDTHNDLEGDLRVDSNMVTHVYLTLVGINESNNSKFSIYPNPASNQIEIEHINSTGIMEITLVNQDGRVITQKNTSQSKIQMDVSFISAGVYYLKIVCNDKTSTQSIIIR